MHICTCMLYLWYIHILKSFSHSVMSDSLQLHGLWPARPFCPQNSPGKNTGVGCHSRFPGDLPDPGIKPGSPALWADALPSEPPGKHIHVWVDLYIHVCAVYLYIQPLVMEWKIIFCYSGKILPKASYYVISLTMPEVLLYCNSDERIPCLLSFQRKSLVDMHL